MRKNLGNFEYQRSSTQMRPRPLLREKHKRGQRLEIGHEGLFGFGRFGCCSGLLEGERAVTADNTGVKGLELVMRLSGGH